MKIGKNECIKSKRKSPCIYDLVNYVRISKTLTNNIYRCRRCKNTHNEKITLEKPNCLISPTGNHQWKYQKNISFQQHWKHQQIRDLECCEYCTATREISYARPIGYNPHS